MREFKSIVPGSFVFMSLVVASLCIAIGVMVWFLGERSFQEEMVADNFQRQRSLESRVFELEVEIERNELRLKAIEEQLKGLELLQSKPVDDEGMENR